MTSKSITTTVSSSGKKTLGDLGKGIKKLHVDYDKQLKNAKTRGKLRQADTGSSSGICDIEN